MRNKCCLIHIHGSYRLENVKRKQFISGTDSSCNSLEFGIILRFSSNDNEVDFKHVSVVQMAIKLISKTRLFTMEFKIIQIIWSWVLIKLKRGVARMTSYLQATNTWRAVWLTKLGPRILLFQRVFYLGTRLILDHFKKQSWTQVGD